MLRNLIANSYEKLIEVILWVSLIGALLGGAKVGGLAGVAGGIGGAIVGFVIWVFVMTLLTGFFLVVVDIRSKVSSIEEQMKKKIQEQS